MSNEYSLDKNAPFGSIQTRIVHNSETDELAVLIEIIDDETKKVLAYCVTEPSNICRMHEWVHENTGEEDEPSVN